MTLLTEALLALFGIVISLFVYWKALRDDYTQNQIFVSGFTIVGTTVLGAQIAQWASTFIANTSVFAKDGLWFWGSVLGFLLGYMINIFRYKFRLIESFEAASLTILLLSVFFARNVFLAVFLLLLFFLAVFLRNNYRKFTWYKSGKIGFASLFTLGLLFLVRAVVTIIPLSNSLPKFFIGKVDTVISLMVAVTLFFAFYNLARLK